MEPILEPLTVQTVTEAVPLLLRFPMGRFWVDHDREADVLYISFRRPQQATDTRMTKEGILLRSRGKELVGITVLEASTRAQASQTPPPTSKAKASKRSRKKA
jgi:uncharacterized protein YuzE